ncbi:TetR/AcrR family transcriptional regulator [Qiania dongpingensis]|uniref:TetR/AcrR family transcriptional regulator n=1 Tax=Qiania dongpingensis TaxID=2763669 RepID=A0A7G9G317_9FIRM|nr:TetR/AcrR family transcriptional regulator [Qiania dongpingensis]QNM05199.1 TetR/AcrR family transcriptional regulator [Qiania dongpingensis]
MNTPNNKRRRDSQKRIEAAFIQQLQYLDLNKISVTDICKSAGVNRTTFYANYLDVYDLADAVQRKLEEEVFGLYKEEREQKYNSNDFLKLFRHIKENQMFYKTYFKLGLDGKFEITEYDVHQAASYYDNQYIEYHMEFFRNGLNAIIKKWLQNDCEESPEEIASIIMAEYGAK